MTKNEFIGWKSFWDRILIGFRTHCTFVEVVRPGRFSQPAKVVFTTHSTVSKVVKQLEIGLSVPLLDQKGNRGTLTQTDVQRSRVTP